MLKTTDNNCGRSHVEQKDIENFSKIANIKIKDINLTDYANILVYPHNFNDLDDKIYDESIFSLQENTLTTGNIMGFVGVNESEITIKSRFSKEENDYFLHYMLQKVFSLNLFELKHQSNKENIFDFLIYLFPFFLKKALAQGLYKEYRYNTYNDSNVKGSINVNEHIKRNSPFNGKVIYSFREHSFDNKITQLVRHTIEFIRNHKFMNGILSNDLETKNCVGQILQATTTYSKRKRISIINENIRPLIHPYYHEYKDLQRICLQILRYDGLKFGEQNDKIYGLLFDGAWLWEEYLYTILKDCHFNHPLNKISKGAIYLFSNPKRYKRYPDFWKYNFVIDAKYKHLSNPIDRNDMNQIISYMYVKQAEIGGFLFPSKKTEVENVGQLDGYGGNVNTWTLGIPQNAEDYNDFCSKIIYQEEKLKCIINQNCVEGKST